MATYRIVRFYYSPSDDPDPNPPRIMEPRVSLEEAQAHCNRPDTRGPTLCIHHGLTVKLKTGDQQYDRMHRATAKYYTGPKPAFCPTCGEPTVTSWFDGWTAN